LSSPRQSDEECKQFNPNQLTAIFLLQGITAKFAKLKEGRKRAWPTAMPFVFCGKESSDQFSLISWKKQSFVGVGIMAETCQHYPGAPC